MTPITVGVIGRSVGRQFDVRVMTCDAGEMRVIGIVAATVEQAIRLKAHIPYTAKIRHHGDSIHAPVARPAKFL